MFTEAQTCVFWWLLLYVVDPLGKIKTKTVQNDEPKDVLALLAAKDNLTNSVDVEKEFALDN